MTRAEHLAWCKTRALQYVDMDDPTNAFASICSDLRKHPATEDHGALTLGAMLVFGGHLETSAKMRDFITGIQ